MVVMSRRFLEWMGTTGYSPETVTGWEMIFKYFIKWCDERGITSVQEVTRPVLERYQRYLYLYRKQSGEPLTIGTQEGRLIPLKSFFKWLAKNKYILYNPASELEMPRREYHLPRHVLSSQEVETILHQVDLTQPMGIRDRAILETLYSTGMRRTELCYIKRYDIDLHRGTVIIRHGKGRKERLIPIGERALLWIEKYLWELRPRIVMEPDEGILFLTRYGKPLRPKHLTRIVHEVVKASGIGKEGSCHMFRHTMATLMLEGGADIRYIQQMLGHSSLETTQIYTQVAINKLKEIHSNTHPAARLKSDSQGAEGTEDTEGTEVENG